MKQFVYILILALGVIVLPSCDDDNYSEPNSGIKGRIIDEDTSEPVPMPVQGHGSSVKIRMFEKDRLHSTGADHSEMPVDFNAQMDGTYSNTWMFSTDYLATIEQANFYPIDTIAVTLKGGKITEYDIPVTPYARVEVVSAKIVQVVTGGALTQRDLKVTYKIDRSRHDYKIQSAFLAWHLSPYIDNASGNSSGKASVDYSATPDAGLLNVNLIQTYDLLNDGTFNDVVNKAIIKGNENRIFVRIGVSTNGKTNYTVSVPVTVSFLSGE
ncbi:DUF3823 domain-containing protein [Dysgonomonas sp. 25]|uniref:DUF3823 domain-containing protein n=1 Tax=Dysgonomonas sp. 25 TaxID=2302933 RepID=UPI0013D3627C|nr:DUF3823 domain-containing protein [Dysgonomonas sp. 25]NDV67983.1 DUF3823 domain-containing protein [Dysgonomonas sp. 25]